MTANAKVYVTVLLAAGAAFVAGLLIGRDIHHARTYRVPPVVRAAELRGLDCRLHKTISIAGEMTLYWTCDR